MVYSIKLKFFNKLRHFYLVENSLVSPVFRLDDVDGAISSTNLSTFFLQAILLIIHKVSCKKVSMLIAIPTKYCPKLIFKIIVI